MSQVVDFMSSKLDHNSRKYSNVQCVLASLFQMQTKKKKINLNEILKILKKS